MKRDKLFSLLWAVVLSFCVVFGSFSCLITAFSLEADTWSLALFCIAFATISSLVSMTRWGNWILCGVLILLGGWLWQMGSLETSVEALLYQISVVYDMAYGWGTIYWNGAAPTVFPIGLALSAAAVPVIWAVTWTVIRREHSIFAIALAILPLGACLVVTDRVPAADSLFLMVFGFLLLILTQTVRRQKESDGNRLTAILLIPALLCTALLFHTVPQKGYTPPHSVPGWIEGWLSSIHLGPGSMPGAPDITLDLSEIGPKSQNKFVIMEVTTEKSGLLYLRRQSYDSYDGTSWSVSSKVSAQDRYWPSQGLKDNGSLTVKLRASLELMYLPYYTDMLQQLQYGRLENTHGKTYTLQWMVPDGSSAVDAGYRLDPLVEQCLRLPDSTQQQAQNILQQIGDLSSLTDAQKANRIAEYVKSVAVYDLKTAKIPQEETDFAIWFLENADTGYCVHFATAATVLLRAAGIPARYVTGYMTEVEGGVKEFVISNESHAWVEYLDSKGGWTVLDPTPPEPEQLPTEPPAPTEDPDPTEDTTATEEPTSAPTDPSTGPGPTGVTQPMAASPSDTSANGGADAPQKTDLALLWNCLMAVACAALVMLLVWGQYLLRVQLRHRKMRSGSPNQRALICWKEIVRLSRLYRQPLSEEMEMLAQKAKFSQYTMTGEEIKVFQTRLKELSTLLAQKRWYQRLFYKLLFAAE